MKIPVTNGDSFNKLGDVKQKMDPRNSLHSYVILLTLTPGRFLNVGLKVFLKIIFYPDGDQF